MYRARRVSEPANPSGLCWCGCGQLTPIATKNSAKRGYYIGQHVRYINGHQTKRGAENPRWKGGRFIHKTGYVYIHKPEHPSSNRDGYVLEHRYVMEAQIGRYLYAHEHVHHINGDKADNRLENLVVLTKKAHHKLHAGEWLQRWRAENPELAREAAREAGRRGAEKRWRS